MQWLYFMTKQQNWKLVNFRLLGFSSAHVLNIKSQNLLMYMPPLQLLASHSFFTDVTKINIG